MPPLNNSKHSTLPPESALAALFFPAGGSYQEGVQKTPAERSAGEKYQETEAEEQARKMGLEEEEDWTDDDVFIPDIK
ncbi:hypothetical protein VSDG_08314 [Cytospora chrysosperma]|uniref:Uncharacterized protein n=1 Tax=Cytospora chrysosperma TaxID=252740 RepID=A0A423VI80_CYTCH|nr:hypothetical protein VSDG_08314 [Valsa sordida]